MTRSNPTPKRSGNLKKTMIMKKIYTLLFAAAALVAAASCTKTEIVSPESETAPAKVSININVASLGPESKALKSGWEAGDKIHVYLEDANTYVPDFDLTFDGTQWTASELSSAVIDRLAANGTLRGFWESSNNCMGSASWEKYGYYIDFPGSDNKSSTGQIQYIVADFSAVSYTFNGSTLTANINAWRFRANIQIVVTGISFSPGRYTLYSEWIDSFSGISVCSGAPYSCYVSYNSTGSDGGRIGGIANDDGVAFVGGMSYGLSMGDSVTIYLVDNSTSTTYSFTKTATAVVGNDGTKITGIKIPFSKFTLPGEFSVSNTKKVHFSPGNLQYQASTATWRFAEHQWDYVGNAEGNTTTGVDRATQADWIDLFAWGTSGYDDPSSDHDVYYHPWDNTESQYYGPGSVSGFDISGDNLTGDLTKYDWGVYNAIGAYPAGTWRTLTADEWQWLLAPKTGDPDPGTNCRTSSTVNGVENARYAKASVSGINGLIIFPDSYTHPDGVTLPSGINTGNAAYTVNTYTAADWSAIQAAGAVFLPAAGYRYWYKGSDYRIDGNNTYGGYWTRTCGSNNGNAQAMYFSESNVNTYDDRARWTSISVRLVRDVE